ncbi:MAG: serine dehydratase subunit alpha family protein [Clostridiales bacterium]|nr:serine dehydratase subunit alpha family protein [Clostridiales bacterium]
MITKHIYDMYVDLLQRELVPALGCTEPIAIAYASAKAREVLGEFPDTINVECSGNIIKNVKGVVVPTTGNLRGVDTSAIIGAVGGNSDLKLEVLSEITPAHVEKTKALLDKNMCCVDLKRNVSNLYIRVRAEKGNDYAEVEIVDQHTNIVRIEKNGEILFVSQEVDNQYKKVDKQSLSVENIYDFANAVVIDDVKEPIERQIKYNTDIANEGILHNYGVNVGKVLMRHNKDDIKNIAKAYAAAGSDARMAGSILPVIINSGSGNQGMAVSLPVIKYAEHLKVSHEKLIRALVFSNLLSLYQKSGIGNLSAYCGAVSAACGAGAGISYLYDLPLDDIKKTIKNTLGNVAGIVCDGAKSSCAAKVASAVDAAIFAHEMASCGESFGSGEGLNLEDVDETIANVSHLAKKGMKETDIEILEMMIKKKDN